ncbi:hypothetical protein M3Y94_00551300 [Aphelenchoides besseyi]|nr:hypothetical protein M3Y94_00551300 [Aphelenchoides besseyi]
MRRFAEPATGWRWCSSRRRNSIRLKPLRRHHHDQLVVVVVGANEKFFATTCKVSPSQRFDVSHVVVV